MRARVRSVAGLAVLAVLPGAATAQPVDPAVIGRVPGIYRAAGSFVLVFLFGSLLLVRYERFVDESIDAWMERPYVAVLYGLLANGLVAFLGFLALMQLSQAGVGGPVVTLVVAAFVGTGLLVLAGLGYLVVGAGLTGLYGSRRTWKGLAFGAALSTVGWLAFPLATGALAWIAVASVGVGGPMRTWMHSERAVDVERRS
jgi:hypothetical protein